MQVFEGLVTSAKSKDTVAVEIVYFKKHPKYKKVLKKTTNLLVHNEIAGVKEGDMVEIENSRPYSKNKHFKVKSILNSAVVKETESKKEVEKSVKETKPEEKKEVKKAVTKKKK